jgi:hypothetical protein
MKIACIAVLACCMVSGAAWAQNLMIAPPATPTGYSELQVSKAALSGGEIRLWETADLEPDCTAHGVVQLEILQAPSHGTVMISDAPFYPNYPESNLRYACDSKKSPGKQAFYTSQAGFEGHDTVVLRASDFDGTVRKIIVDVNVLGAK